MLLTFAFCRIGQLIRQPLHLAGARHLHEIGSEETTLEARVTLRKRNGPGFLELFNRRSILLLALQRLPIACAIRPRLLSHQGANRHQPANDPPCDTHQHLPSSTQTAGRMILNPRPRRRLERSGTPGSRAEMTDRLLFATGGSRDGSTEATRQLQRRLLSDGLSVMTLLPPIDSQDLTGNHSPTRRALTPRKDIPMDKIQRE